MVYIHVPFCKRKCLYCDFFSVRVSHGTSPYLAYAEGIAAEIRRRADEFTPPLSTIYIGGGTPSLLPAEALQRILGALAETAGPLATVREMTLEVNPDDVTPQKIEAWKSLGVNRISMGVQSLVDSELRAVGRRHTARQAVDAARMLTDAFGNVSLDLIFGLPGQTRESLQRSLRGITDLHPQHVSVYGLTYEEGTPLTRMRERGMLEEADEEMALQMFRDVREHLCSAGYEHYEISNFAIPGYRSLHNSSYWTGRAYVGLGPGAHSYDGERRRRANPAGKGCIDAMDWYEHPEVEVLSDGELLEEYVMTRLRTAEGIDLADFSRRFGEASTERLLSRAKPHLSRSHLRHEPATPQSEGGTLHLTTEGIMLSDAIILDLCNE